MFIWTDGRLQLTARTVGDGSTLLVQLWRRPNHPTLSRSVEWWSQHDPCCMQWWTVILSCRRQVEWTAFGRVSGQYCFSAPEKAEDSNKEMHDVKRRRFKVISYFSLETAMLKMLVCCTHYRETDTYQEQLKYIIYKSVLWPLLMFGCEVWTLMSATNSKVQGAEMRVLRSTKGVTRKDRLRNEDIRKELWCKVFLRTISTTLAWTCEEVNWRKNCTADYSGLHRPHDHMDTFGNPGWKISRKVWRDEELLYNRINSETSSLTGSRPTWIVVQGTRQGYLWIIHVSHTQR